MSNDWKKRLSKIKNFDAAKTSAEQLGGSLPDNQYLVKLTSAELAESQASGREQINMFMEVLEGEFAGQSCANFAGLDEEKSLPFTISMLRKLGFEIEEPEQIVDAVDSLNFELPQLIIRVKKGFVNILSRADAVQEDQIGEEQEQEQSSEEEVAEEAQIEVGSEVVFDWKGEQMEGKVKEITEEKIKVSSGGKVYPVKPEAVELKAEEEAEVEEEQASEEEVAEEPEDEPVEEAPKARKVTKKALPKKAAKKVTKRR